MENKRQHVIYFRSVRQQEAFKGMFRSRIRSRGFITVHAVCSFLGISDDDLKLMFCIDSTFDYGWTSERSYKMGHVFLSGLIDFPEKLMEK